MTVRQGDCLTSIAAQHGFTWAKLWNHPDNADLRQLRKDPNVLYPGDVVMIPDLEERIESGATEARHRFRLKEVPAEFSVRLIDEDGEPLAHLPFEFVIGVRTIDSGQTDGDGKIELPLPPDATEGELTITDGDETWVFPLDFGALDPIDTDDGASQRLQNLSYVDQDDAKAVELYQHERGLEATGELDDATRRQLESDYGV